MSIDDCNCEGKLTHQYGCVYYLRSFLELCDSFIAEETQIALECDEELDTD